MAAKAHGDKPSKVFNLDTLEQDDVRAPFLATVGGRRVEFVDIREVSGRELATINDRDVTSVIRAITPEDDFDHVMELPGWKLGKLAQAYRDHYGVADQGESAAS